MGTGGPGNIVHIDNLYVKTFNVKDNVNITLGQFVVIEDDGGFAVARPLVDADFTGADLFLDLSISTKITLAPACVNVSAN